MAIGPKAMKRGPTKTELVNKYEKIIDKRLRKTKVDRNGKCTVLCPMSFDGESDLIVPMADLYRAAGWADVKWRSREVWTRSSLRFVTTSYMVFHEEETDGA